MSKFGGSNLIGSILAGWLFLVFSLAFILTPGGSRAQEPILIGVPIPMSGSLSSFGNMMKNSFEMAKADINGNGGINGRPIELRYGDTKGEADAGKKAVESLKQGGAVMLVGGYASSGAFEMAARAESLKIPFLICTASADKITQMGWSRIYRLNPPISEYTKSLEDFWIKNKRPRSMAIVFENSMFGTNAATHMMAFCRGNSIEIHSIIGYPRDRITSFYLRPLLAPLTQEPPDVIYVVSYLADGVKVVREISDLKTGALVCGGGGGFTQKAFIEAAGPAAEFMLTASLWAPCAGNPGAEKFHRRYMRANGEPPDYHGAEAYAALTVAADALTRASSTGEADIRKALDDTYMKTIFGPVKFYNYESFQRQNTHRPLVLQIIDGDFQCIWPPDLAGAQFVMPKP